jgi:sugar phosphate permease
MNSSATELERTLRRLRVGVLVALSLAAGSAYLTRHCIAVANTTIQAELGLSVQQMGWILGSFSLGYFIFQVPGGWLGNRIGTRVAFPLISILWSLMTFASSLAGSWLVLGATRAAYGAAQAGMVPLSAQIIRDWFRENQRGLCSAIMSASMSAGGVVAMGLTAWLLQRLPWREVFRLYSLVGIIWAIAFYAFFRTRPDQHPRLRRYGSMDGQFSKGAGMIGSSQGVETGEGNGSSENEQSVESPSRPLERTELLTGRALAVRIATNRTLWGINLQSYFRSAGYALLVTWLPAFLEYRFGVGPDRAGGLAMYPLAGVIVGSLLGGWAVDRLLTVTGSKWLSRVGLAVIGLGICAALTFASSWAVSAGGFVALIAAGAGMSGFANPPAGSHHGCCRTPHGGDSRSYEHGVDGRWLHHAGCSRLRDRRYSNVAR